MWLYFMCIDTHHIATLSLNILIYEGFEITTNRLQ